MLHIVATQELFEKFTVDQLRLLLTDEKVELFKELCAGPPSSIFLSYGPQEQAEHLYAILHPGETEENAPADRLTNYIELLEHLSTTKHALRESTRNVKDYSNLEAEVLTQLLISARAMASTMEEFHRIVGMACFV
jgi:hypothetical protein